MPGNGHLWGITVSDLNTEPGEISPDRGKSCRLITGALRPVNHLPGMATAGPSALPACKPAARAGSECPAHGGTGACPAAPVQPAELERIPYQGRGLSLSSRYHRQTAPELQICCSCAQWR